MSMYLPGIDSIVRTFTHFPKTAELAGKLVSWLPSNIFNNELVSKVAAQFGGKVIEQAAIKLEVIKFLKDYSALIPLDSQTFDLLTTLVFSALENEMLGGVPCYCEADIPAGAIRLNEEAFFTAIRNSTTCKL